MGGRIRVCSVFSGVGGLDLGFIATERFLIRRAYDVSPSAVATYERNIGPHIQKLDLSKSLPPVASSDIDLVLGGPPCQEFSVGGKRGGVGSERGALALRFVEIVEHLRPKMFVFENVEGLVQAEMRPCFKRILAGLQALGYRTFPKDSSDASIRSCTLDASDLGVAQRRRRIFIVGSCDGSHTEFAFPYALPGPKKTLWDAVGHLPVLLRQKSPEGIPDHDLASAGRYFPGFNTKFQAHHRVWQADRPGRCVHSHMRTQEVHPSGRRRFTLREIALIQSFPPQFEFAGNFQERLQNVVNAVPPLMAFHLAGAVADFYSRAWTAESRNCTRITSGLKRALEVG